MTARQERLWLTEPARKTCLAGVMAVRGGAFAADRALFAPAATTCRHRQGADKGTVWIEGEKRRLQRVSVRDGLVWYRLRGTTPEVGVRLQCELDQDTRGAASRAHTAMHLMMRALDELGAPPLTADPEIKGGGHARITLAWQASPTLLAEALALVARDVMADIPVEHDHVTRELAGRVVTPQAFDPPDPIPGGDVLPLVRIGKRCTYPCDGTHVDRTGRIGHVVVTHARPGKDGFVVVLRAR